MLTLTLNIIFPKFAVKKIPYRLQSRLVNHNACPEPINVKVPTKCGGEGTYVTKEVSF